METERLNKRTYEAYRFYDGTQLTQLQIATLAQAIYEDYIRAEAHWSEGNDGSKKAAARVMAKTGHTEEAVRAVQFWIGCFIDGHHDTTGDGVMAYVHYTRRDWLDWAYLMITDE